MHCSVVRDRGPIEQATGSKHKVGKAWSHCSVVRDRGPVVSNHLGSFLFESLQSQQRGMSSLRAMLMIWASSSGIVDFKTSHRSPERQHRPCGARGHQPAIVEIQAKASPDEHLCLLLSLLRECEGRYRTRATMEGWDCHNNSYTAFCRHLRSDCNQLRNSCI